MPKLIIDADDFGLSKAINHGIIESYKTGITTSTLLMPNLETAEHAIALAKDHPDLFIGQHTNFLLGKPCANPAEIPSLVDENGEFHRSKYYRANPELKFQYEDVRTETIAQMERFKALTGHYPEHIDCHSIGDETVDQAFFDIAYEFGIHTTLKYSGDKKWPDQEGYLPITKLLESGALPYTNGGVSIENFLNDDFGLLKLAPNEIAEMHFDVGFLDQFVLDNSSYTLMRCRELATICDVRVRDWLLENGFELITFGDLQR
ncbi:carbohydrate deacetylase [Listeria innocua]|uniref:ChbG/HpnK family deacetylase n=1 Tax=Listeria innocua TaxID=1642 RepID=UPI00162701FD|nr:carbohydrate deacetylase [Listeria innocua]MBC1908710.1 carbohydrate deacetylase [Listeria innocua]MBC1927605.1 carbohydrate deacetylase [Listeria innocua]